MKWCEPCLDEDDDEDDIAHRQRLQVVQRALEALQEDCSKVVKVVVFLKWYVEDNLEDGFGFIQRRWWFESPKEWEVMEG